MSIEQKFFKTQRGNNEKKMIQVRNVNLQRGRRRRRSLLPFVAIGLEIILNHGAAANLLVNNEVLTCLSATGTSLPCQGIQTICIRFDFSGIVTSGCFPERTGNLDYCEFFKTFADNTCCCTENDCNSKEACEGGKNLPAKRNLVENTKCSVRTTSPYGPQTSGTCQLPFLYFDKEKGIQKQFTSCAGIHEAPPFMAAIFNTRNTSTWCPINTGVDAQGQYSVQNPTLRWNWGVCDCSSDSTGAVDTSECTISPNSPLKGPIKSGNCVLPFTYVNGKYEREEFVSCAPIDIAEPAQAEKYGLKGKGLHWCPTNEGVTEHQNIYLRQDSTRNANWGICSCQNSSSEEFFQNNNTESVVSLFTRAPIPRRPPSNSKAPTSSKTKAPIDKPRPPTKTPVFKPKGPPTNAPVINPNLQTKAPIAKPTPPSKAPTQSQITKAPLGHETRAPTAKTTKGPTFPPTSKGPPGSPTLKPTNRPTERGITLSPTSIQVPMSENDLAAWRQFHADLGGQNWLECSDPNNPCLGPPNCGTTSFRKVDCQVVGNRIRVVSISLKNNHLQGNFPDEMFNQYFSALKVLDVSNFPSTNPLSSHAPALSLSLAPSFMPSAFALNSIYFQPGNVGSTHAPVFSPKLFSKSPARKKRVNKLGGPLSIAEYEHDLFTPVPTHSRPTSRKPGVPSARKPTRKPSKSEYEHGLFTKVPTLHIPSPTQNNPPRPNANIFYNTLPLNMPRCLPGAVNHIKCDFQSTALAPLITVAPVPAPSPMENSLDLYVYADISRTLTCIGQVLGQTCWEQEIAFTNNLQFTLGEQIGYYDPTHGKRTGLRYSISTFGCNKQGRPLTNQVLPLTGDEKSIQAGIKAMKQLQPYNGDCPSMGLANIYQSILSHINDKGRNNQAVVLVTDGHFSNNNLNPSQVWTQKILNLGAQVFAVAAGKQINYAQLLQLTHDPTGGRILLITSFTAESSTNYVARSLYESFSPIHPSLTPTTATKRRTLSPTKVPKAPGKKVQQSLSPSTKAKYPTISQQKLHSPTTKKTTSVTKKPTTPLSKILPPGATRKPSMIPKPTKSQTFPPKITPTSFPLVSGASKDLQNVHDTIPPSSAFSNQGEIIGLSLAGFLLLIFIILGVLVRRHRCRQKKNPAEYTLNNTSLLLFPQEGGLTLPEIVQQNHGKEEETLSVSKQPSAEFHIDSSN